MTESKSDTHILGPPLKIALLHNDIFGRYTTKTIEIKKYSETDDTLLTISKKLNIVHAKLLHTLLEANSYLFMYEGRQLDKDTSLEKVWRHINYDRTEPIVALVEIKESLVVNSDVMATMFNFLGTELDNPYILNRNNDDDNDNNIADSNEATTGTGTGDMNPEVIDEVRDPNGPINPSNLQPDSVESHIETMVNMGFRESDAERVIIESMGNLDLAIHILISDN
jgi:hypothetical protein